MEQVVGVGQEHKGAKAWVGPINDVCDELVSGVVSDKVRHSANGASSSAASNDCSILETRARIQWLKLARVLIVNPLPKESDWSKEILLRLDSR